MAISVVVWDPEGGGSEARLSAVLSIHKANRSRLGPMPDAAFRQRADHNGLLLGLSEDVVAGYVLYDLPRRNLVKLIHVCVSSEARGTGLARVMVDEAIRLNPSRSLIAASCRADYGIDEFWQSLGMHSASERAGRAINGSILTNWVKRINVDHGGLDLLESASLASGLPVAVLDTNVIGDLFAPPEIRRDHREESLELSADWLQPLVNFAVSGQVDNEISKNQDAHVRAVIRAASQHLTRLSTLRPGDRTLEESLLDATRPRLVAQDPSLRLDVLHVADAIHAGADYFVTNDANLREASDSWNLTEHGIVAVVRPHELIAALSPQPFMSDFRSSLIEDLEWTEVRHEDPALELAFRVYDIEAKPNTFKRRLRQLLAKRATTTVQKLVDAQGSPWALAAFELVGDVLRLQLLRAIRGERGSTVAFQLLRHFRRTAWDHGATRIEIFDEAISRTISSALDSDGFSAAMPRTAELGPSTATASSLQLETAAAVALAERERWPLVVGEAQLPTYLIPIQPRWATRLLGLEDGLFSMRRRGLGLSRELVYFSGSRLVPKSLPARVLWYVSADRTATVQRVVARSVLIDSARLSAEDAANRFARLGVLRQSEIAAAGDRSGRVNVIRFQDTEILGRSISRHDPIFRRYVKDNVQSMQSVDPRMFEDVISLQLEDVSE